MFEPGVTFVIIDNSEYYVYILSLNERMKIHMLYIYIYIYLTKRKKYKKNGYLKSVFLMEGKFTISTK